MHGNSEWHRTEKGVAQKVSVILVDDMNGGEAAETVEFGLDGTGYEIDLSTQNSRALRDALKLYIEKGRKVRGTGRRPSRSRTAPDEEKNKKMRTWAKEQGLSINERGRVPAGIAAQYEEANAR